MARSTWKRDTYRWNISTLCNNAAQLASELKTSPLVAQVLHNRGITEASAATAFLKPSLARDLLDPVKLGGCTQAAEIIAKAVAAGKKVVIYQSKSASQTNR